MHLVTLIAVFFLRLPSSCSHQHHAGSLRQAGTHTLAEDSGYWERLLDNVGGSMSSHDESSSSVAGMVIVPSIYSFDETYSNLIAALDMAPVNIFAEISHSDAATSVGLTLDPNKLAVFGNPNLGTPIMQENREVGVDLPQKMLVWEDNYGKVFVGYNSVDYLKFRHDGIEDAPTLDLIAGALLNVASTSSGVPTTEILVDDIIHMESSGVISETSDADFNTTWLRLIAAIEQSPANVLLTVDHSANANNVGLDLPRTRLVVFGTPVLGTSLMQVSPTVGIDLPLKMLVWEDDDGSVQVTTNDVEFIASRHEIKGVDDALDRIKTSIQNFMTVATVTKL